MLAFIPKERIARVRLLRTVLGWVACILFVIGVVSYVVSALPHDTQGPNFGYGFPFSLLGFGGVLFGWVPSAVGWAVITVLLEIYDLFRAGDETPVDETGTSAEAQPE
jgi:FtsH-binding integral membrane protein